MNAEDRSKMNTKYAFAVGALSRDDLEGMASDLSISYDKHTTSDSLRSDVLASLDKQGEPCVKVEYDCAYTGGDYDGVGTFTYIPLSLIAAANGFVENAEEAIDAAFRKQTSFDSMHIIHHESDEVYTKDGNFFVGAELLDSTIYQCLEAA